MLSLNLRAHGISRQLTLGAGALLALIAPAGGSATAAVSTEPPALHEMQVIDQALAPARALVQTVRSTLHTHTAFAAVQAAAITAGDNSALADLPAAPGAPATLSQAVDTIELAVTQASTIVRASPAWQLTRKLGVNGLVHQLVQGATAAQQVVAHLQALGISPSPALRAAAIVARAVDSATPALQAAAAATPHSTAAASAPCEVLNKTPNLCVSGTSDSTFIKDEAVIIDLGGNDTFSDNAGAASPSTNLPVSLVVTVGGNDTYAAPTSVPQAQGSAIGGGVGMLVQLSGTDTFSILNNHYNSIHGNLPLISISGTAGALAQGQGFLGGAGFLVTAASGSTFAETSSTTAESSGASGQGTGFFAGVGALVDFGTGNSYSLSAAAYPKATTLTDPVTGKSHAVSEYGNAGVDGQGVGVFGGAGLLFDEGGAETFSMTSTLEGAAANAAPVTPNPADTTTTLESETAGQGYGGFAAHGMLVTGSGPKRYLQTARTLPSPSSNNITTGAFGQGVGALATGVLSDTGGGDVFSLIARASSAVATTAVDGCTTTCPPAVASDAGPADAEGQGFGVIGVGLLDVGSGGNRFTATASDAARLTISDQRSTPHAPIQGQALAQVTTVQAQGIGGDGGAGALVVRGGHNSFSVGGSSTATATGSSTLAANRPSVQASTSGVAEDSQGTGDYGVSGQPTGGALLAVLKGGGDRFSAAGTASSTVNGVASPGGVAMYVQGAADPSGGLGVAVDLVAPGATNVWTQSPAYAACSGTRGSGAWEDCNHYGFGYNGP